NPFPTGKPAYRSADGADRGTGTKDAAQHFRHPQRYVQGHPRKAQRHGYQPPHARAGFDEAERDQGHAAIISSHSSIKKTSGQTTGGFSMDHYKLWLSFIPPNTAGDLFHRSTVLAAGDRLLHGCIEVRTIELLRNRESPAARGFAGNAIRHESFAVQDATHFGITQSLPGSPGF